MKLLGTLAALAATLAFAGAALASGAPTTKSVRIGGTFTVSGRTGSAFGAGPATGAVVMSGRWNVGPWHVIASSHTDFGGRYRITIKLSRRGTLHLRVSPPDGDDHLFVLRVV
jgi:hypothetical protein